MNGNQPRSPLEIPELLEDVLLHLAQGNILQLQRVNHFWADIISESPLLQQKLFFQPLPPSKAAGRPAEFNPIVEALFPFLFELHPFAGGWFMKGEAEETIQHWASNPASRRAVLRPEASWRRMLPVQPAAPIDAFVMNEWILGNPVKSLVEWCKVDPSKYVSTSAATSNLGRNATMGLLYDIILPHLSSSWDAAINVQWNMVKLTYDSCSKSHPRYGGLLGGFVNYKMFEYEKVKQRNTITIHAEQGFRPGGENMYLRRRASSPLPKRAPRIVYYALKKVLLAIIPEWLRRNLPRPAGPTDLGIILDLPAGVVRAGNKANRYPEGNMETDYLYWGKLAPGLKSELEMELCERVKELLVLNRET